MATDRHFNNPLTSNAPQSIVDHISVSSMRRCYQSLSLVRFTGIPRQPTTLCIELGKSQIETTQDIFRPIPMPLWLEHSRQYLAALDQQRNSRFYPLPLQKTTSRPMTLSLSRSCTKFSARYAGVPKDLCYVSQEVNMYKTSHCFALKHYFKAASLGPSPRAPAFQRL